MISPAAPGARPATSRFLDACRFRNPSRPPVWIMRQAGRYLPEYRRLRERHSFVELCTVPDLAVEVSLQPHRRFGFDAVIVFYDILFLAQAMGAPVEFTENGPVFRSPVRTPADVNVLHAPDLASLDPGKGTGAVLESLRRLRREVPADTAVLGFAGAPFTVAAYLVEGSFERSGERMKRLLNEDPGAAHVLLDKLAAATRDYAAELLDAGADAVQLFDTWAGLLGPADYSEFALPYASHVFGALKSRGAPLAYYLNGCAHLLELLPRTGATVLSLDWRVPLHEARARLGTGVALQGNLDPTALFAPPDKVRQLARSMVESLAGDRGYIVNLGHGILPETPLASVEALVAAARGES